MGCFLTKSAFQVKIVLLFYQNFTLLGPNHGRDVIPHNTIKRVKHIISTLICDAPRYDKKEQNWVEKIQLLPTCHWAIFLCDQSLDRIDILLHHMIRIGLCNITGTWKKRSSSRKDLVKFYCIASLWVESYHVKCDRGLWGCVQFIHPDLQFNCPVLLILALS